MFKPALTTDWGDQILDINKDSILSPRALPVSIHCLNDLNTILKYFIEHQIYWSYTPPWPPEPCLLNNIDGLVNTNWVCSNSLYTTDTVHLKPYSMSPGMVLSKRPFLWPVDMILVSGGGGRNAVFAFWGNMYDSCSAPGSPTTTQQYCSDLIENLISISTGRVLGRRFMAGLCVVVMEVAGWSV